MGMVEVGTAKEPGNGMGSRFQWTTGRRLLGLFLAAGAVYAVMMTVTFPELGRRSGGLTMFDLLPTGYDAAYAYRLLDALGPEGREYYLTRQLPLDVFYPALIALTLAGAWLFLSRRLGLVSRPWRAPTLLPALTALFDYGENLGITAMLLRFPEEIGALARLTSALTIAKSTVSTLCFVGVAALAAAVALRRSRRPRR